MATKEEQEILRLLVQHVSRSFYEPKYTIILDQLARHPVLKDDDLAGRMGLQSKELNKLMAVLSNDRLVNVYRQNELKEGAQRSVGKQYYYIDYQNFCNVVKWRINKMYSMIDSTLRNELDNKGYVCPQCKASYTPLDVFKLRDNMRGTLVCEICQGEVIDNENAESVRGSKDRMERFVTQVRFIREGLQKSESMVLPAFDVALWVKTNTVDPERQKAASGGSDLKIAGADGRSTNDDGVGVMMSMDKDEATQRAERDAAAAAKRQQNALPSWHLKSTISGELTALGIKEQSRAEAAAAVEKFNDDILKGLGVVGGKQDQGGGGTKIIVEEAKPVTDQSSDYYDQYYASLAASAATSTLATPTGLSALGSDDFGDLGVDEEEDQKPSVQYLDSLNDYRKRSRSREDEGPITKTKMPKTDFFAEADAALNSVVNGANNGLSVDGGTLDTAAEDPIVYVNGQPKPYSQVTEEDHDLMTTDEYTAFFEIMQSQPDS
ncbi:hypothetical protein HGRIS_011580 [Hohenbuehelia grisea]|uniref:HTH TFE/IIEalpha-type domain-containing protein n=1 Tax=Hohenbuehelia grisea TaxID=104357 RepID=A0ABR3JVI5_9AGAR